MGEQADADERQSYGQQKAQCAFHNHMVGLSGLLQMGDAQQPVEFGPGQRRCDPHRFADARYEVEIVVLEMFVAVESEPDGADETVARERNFITVRRRSDAPSDVGFGQLKLFLRDEISDVGVAASVGREFRDDDRPIAGATVQESGNVGRIDVPTGIGCDG